MTQEEKAKAYDEALEKARQLCAYPTSKPFISDLQDLFPELKESGDEEIRKVLLELISTYLRGNENGKIHGVYAKDILAWLEKQGKQKPAWSEENEAVLNALIRSLEGEHIYVSPHLAIECLKFLKDRVQPQPKQEWSEEDEKIQSWIIEYVNNLPLLYAKIEIDGEDISTKEYRDKIVSWLKSIRPQNRWKPSDEHIHWLKWAINRMPDTEIANEAEAVLEDLLEELLKL